MNRPACPAGRPCVWSAPLVDRRPADHLAGRGHVLGEVPERSNGAVSKTVGRASVPRVRIPASPPFSFSEASPQGSRAGENVKENQRFAPGACEPRGTGHRPFRLRFRRFSPELWTVGLRVRSRTLLILLRSRQRARAYFSLTQWFASMETANAAVDLVSDFFVSFFGRLSGIGRLGRRCRRVNVTADGPLFT